MRMRMLRRLADALAAFAVLLVLYAASSRVPRGSWDDLAVLRASAWLGTCDPADPLPEHLRAHLERHSASLDVVQLGRYRLRTEFSSNYGLIAPLVRELDRAGRVPVLANVSTACRLQHVLVVLAVLALSWRRQPWVSLTLLGGALALSHPGLSEVASALPFQRQSLTWTASAPRGAAVLAWFGAVAAWLTLRGARRWCAVLGLLLVSMLCHRSMTILCLAASVPTLGLWLALGQRTRWRPSTGLWLAAFCAVALLSAAGKLGLLWYHAGRMPTPFTAAGTGSAADVRAAGLQLAIWAAALLAVLTLWLRTRSLASDAPVAGEPPRSAGESLRSAGDAIALLLGAAGAVCLGLSVAQPTIELWYRSLFFVAEASSRLGAVPHILFFALLAIVLVVRAPRLVTPALLMGAAAASLLAALQLQRMKPPRLPAQGQSLAQLLQRREKAYDNEVQYYLSVAGQIAQHGCELP